MSEWENHNSLFLIQIHFMLSWTITTRYGKWSTKKLKHTICLENNIYYTIEVDRGHFFQFSWRHQSWFLVSKRYINHEVCDFINCLLLSWNTQVFPIMSDVRRLPYQSRIEQIPSSEIPSTNYSLSMKCSVVCM